MIASITGWNPAWPTMTASSIVVFGEFLGFGFDHQHGVGGAGDHEVERRILHLLDRRIELQLAVDDSRRARRRSAP